MRTIILFLYCTALMIAFVIVQCRDPEAPDDPYQETPSPPQPMQPLPDTFFPCTGACGVTFDWTTVQGADIYELQSDTLAAFSTATTYQENRPPATINHIRYHFRTTYYWRVRAGSALWETPYTGWSEIWQFDLIPEGATK